MISCNLFLVYTESKIHVHRHKSLGNFGHIQKVEGRRSFQERQMTLSEMERRSPPKSPIFAFQSIKAYIFPLPNPDHKPSIEQSSCFFFSPSDGKKVTVWLSGASCAIHLQKTNEEVGRNDFEAGSSINDTPAGVTNGLQEDNRPQPQHSLAAARKKGEPHGTFHSLPHENSDYWTREIRVPDYWVHW